MGRGFLLVLAFGALPAAAQSTLDAVRSKGFVQCGVNTGLAGFSLPDSKGVWRGIDVDPECAGLWIDAEPRRVMQLERRSRDRQVDGRRAGPPRRR